MLSHERIFVVILTIQEMTCMTVTLILMLSLLEMM